MWLGLGTFGPQGPFGMITRTSPIFPAVQATGFRVDAFGGDGLYSVSEFQALPEPGLLALLGLGAVGAIRRRFRS